MIAKRLIDGLYTDAMLLADEVRGYFDEIGRETRDRLDPFDRVLFSCESLKATTRLMHVIAWLLTQRAVEVGELTAERAREPARQLGEPVWSDADALARLPDGARLHVEASIELHRRAARLEAKLASATPVLSPARMMHHRLLQAF